MTEPQDKDWTIPDLIDFELWVREEHDIAEEEKSARKKENRRLCKALDDESRRDFFLKWVRAKRNDRHPKSESVGIIAYHWFNFSAVVMGTIGVVLGFSVVNAFFPEIPKGGAQRPPIDIIGFAAVSIVIPVLLVVGVLALCVSGRLGGTLTKIPAYLRLFPWYLIRIPLERAIHRTVDRINSSTELDAATLVGHLRSLLTSRKSLLSGYFAVWIQTLGVGYALALPLAIFFQNAKTSQDYRWETNFNHTVTAERIHAFTSVVATPWSWWKGAGHGVPSLNQVKATKFVKYSAADSRAADAWGVWGTFLTLSAFVYVTLPRLGLCAFSLRASRLRLRRETFHEARFDELAEALTNTDGGWGKQESPDTSRPSPERPVTPSTAKLADHFLLAIPKDLHSDALDRCIRDHFKQTRSWDFDDTVVVPSDVANFQTLMEQLTTLARCNEGTRFVFVEDAASPPVGGQIRRLQSIREKLGPKAGIVISLLGPSSDSPLGDAPTEATLQAWQKKIRATGDPNIRVLHFHDTAPS